MRDGNSLLFDGAMGTYFAELYSTASSRCELANLTAPDAILRIHREYIAAGAQAIKTNTFGANTALLGMDMSGVAQVLSAGWRLACEAAEGRAQLFADIGPIPLEDGMDAEIEYNALADAFLCLGAERFLFETFPEYESVLKAARHIKSLRPGAFLLAQFAVTPDGFTREGISGREIMQAMEGSADIDAWGFNCVSGPLYLYEYMAGLGPFNKPVSAMPNAGYPLLEGSRTVYRNNPDYFAAKLLQFNEIGISILGGCCGTTPEHIRKAAALCLSGRAAEAPHAHPAGAAEEPLPVGNPFWEKLRRGEKAVAAEVDPPQDAAAGPMLEGAAVLMRAGADIVTVSDNPLARVRADSSMAAALIRRRYGCAVLPHIACRDRNLNAIKSLLLGLHIEGVRNVLVVTGDPVALADRSEVKGVYNSNSGMLAGYIRSLNEGVFSREPFVIGAALNVNAPNFDAELARAENKIARGVQFFMTQPLFSPEAADALRRAKDALDARILAGILPLCGYANAQFINNEVPGMTIPGAVMERFRGLGRIDAERLGLDLAGQTAREILTLVDGFYVITPLNRFSIAGKLIKTLRSMIDDQNR